MEVTIAYIVLLLLAAMVLVLFELLTPTFGVLATLALAALAGSIWLAFTVNSVLGLIVLLVALVGTPVYIVMLVRLLPKTRVGRSLFLGQTPKSSATAAPDLEHYRSLIGKTGVAETTLRPSGAVRVDGGRIIAQAESGIIEKGETVEVIAANMADVIVRRVPKAD